jgi:flagellar biogenesis protein FliO
MLTSQPGAPSPARRWTPLALIGLLAVTAGIVLPQALPTVPAAVPAAVAEPASKGKLTYTPPAVPEAPDARAMLTKLGVATAAVLALCVVTLWLGRRWLAAPAAQNPAGRQLRLIETLALGNRCNVYLVHVANRPVLIGADPSGLKSVVPLPESFESALGASLPQELDLPASDPKEPDAWPTRQNSLSS